jgi:hypothetical protein
VSEKSIASVFTVPWMSTTGGMPGPPKQVEVIRGGWSIAWTEESFLHAALA